MENTNTLSKNPAPKKGVLRAYPKSLVTCIILLFFCYLEYYSRSTYVDEASAVVFFVLLIFSIPKITRRDMITFFLIILAVVIGLLGNLIYGLNASAFSVLVDVLSQLKMPLAFFAVKYVLSENEKQQTINLLVPIAKVFVTVNAVLALVSQVVHTPFAEGERYGLRIYEFTFKFAHQYATVAFIMLGVIVCCNTLSKQAQRFYTVMGVIAALMTFKSFSLIFTVIFLTLTVYFKRYNRVKVGLIVSMILVILLVSTYQINEYLVEETSPRRLFIDYSITDANTHFPLGSGFATFGSAEAAKHYSPLYYEYGFNVLFGMTPTDGSFLVDTYWPTVIGQLGWIGAFLFIVMYIRMFINLGYSSRIGNRRAFLYAMFTQYMIHAIGGAILQSSTGMLGFMFLSLCTMVDEDKENKSRKVKLHIDT